MIYAKDLHVGQHVTHFQYGDGEIRRIDVSDNTIYVEFPKEYLTVWYGVNDPDIAYGSADMTEVPVDCEGMSSSGVPLQPRSKHYQDMGIDVLTFCKANLEGFSGYEGALMLPITKYIWRRKDNRLEDLLKARDFLDLLIAYEEEHV